MAAPKGNKFGLKIKTPDLRQEAYKEFCAWLARGKSPRSFTFEREDLMCTGQTIISYIEQYPEEFPPINKELAFCKGLSKWEEVCEQSADGTNEKANTASLQMVMRNKFKWDAKEHSVESKTPEQDRNDILIEQEIQRRVSFELHKRGTCKSGISPQQSVLDKRLSGKSNQVQDELGADSAMERSSSLQDSSEGTSARNNDVFMPPFP